MSIIKDSCNCTARILVADDTEFNILPIMHMIKANFNMDIDIAANGKEAVDMYKQGLDKPCKCQLRAYRLIIMDI